MLLAACQAKYASCLGGPGAALGHQVLRFVACALGAAHGTRPDVPYGPPTNSDRATPIIRQCQQRVADRRASSYSLSSKMMRPSKSWPHQSTSCLKRVWPRSAQGGQ